MTNGNLLWGGRIVVGDMGQRYEHWCNNDKGIPTRLGWSRSAKGFFQKMVTNNPTLYSDHRVIDRGEGYK